MINSYYPIPHSERADWWQNILTVGTPIFSELGLDATLQGNILRDATWAVLAYRTVPETYDQFAKTLTGWCDSYLDGPDGGPGPSVPQIPAFPALPPVSCPTGIEERRTDWVQVIKNNAAYNPLTHGATLKIEQTGTPFAPGDYTAEIKSIKPAGPGKVEVKLDKARGNIDANCVYGRKTGTANFAFLGKFTAATATLTIPGLAPGALEEWEFYTCGVIKDQEIGSPSTHVSAIVKG
jgi:hypothetical protein